VALLAVVEHEVLSHERLSGRFAEFAYSPFIENYIIS
jgi:hypothetical protein